ncbi:hypothetical protein V1279_002183 [Bradyrhizobium sp. AZCC 1610]
MRAARPLIEYAKRMTNDPTAAAMTRGGATTGSAAPCVERVNGRGGPNGTAFKSPLCSLQI